MSERTPILLIGDAPSAQSGLGRILRDLAVRIHTNMSDVFDVATFGYGGIGDRSLPFPQYHIEEMKDWFIPTLPNVWDNFAQGRKGVVFTIWDASRTLWLAKPKTCRDPVMREWLQTKPFKLWGYPAMDATGPNGGLTFVIKETLLGYDRVIAYSQWAEDMISASLTRGEANQLNLHHLPHGIDTSVFFPRDKAKSRSIFTDTLRFNGPKLKDNEKIIGIIATNQARKDYGLAIQALAGVRDIPFRVYIQIDKLERHWSIPALLKDYGLLERAIVMTMPVTDEVMSHIYSACDLTLGIGPEGFGLPIFESLACGTPVLAGSYGGQAEWLEYSIDPVAFRIEGPYNSFRPVHDPQRWARDITSILTEGFDFDALLPDPLDWKNLWPRWQKWLGDGVK